MKKVRIFSLLVLIIACTSNRGDMPGQTDLTNLWDTIRPLENPDKGWYHHMLDNGIGKYLMQDENHILTFPGMDHLYLRLAWAFLEPEEGQFNWTYIDNIVDKYVPMGYGISFRISCKETGPAPTSVPVEIDGIRYATPPWVVEAGAKGVERPEYGSASWTPDWSDPVFMEKLENFHRAFAEKYDGKPWVRYADVGSIGEWGEGHTYFSTRIPATVEEIKTHMDLYSKYYKKTQLVVTDDLLGYGRTEEEMKELLDYAIANGFTLRDDSPLVAGYIENELDTWTVRHPGFFEAAYRTMPTIFEMEHYGKVMDNGYWLGPNGEEVIPEYQVSGAEIFRRAMELIHPTYVGYHGYMGDWLEDNPDLTVQLLNRCGYWYFPEAIYSTSHKNGRLSFEIAWLNRGVAPAYNAYQLRVRLISKDDPNDVIDLEAVDSGNKKWMPGQSHREAYTLSMMKKLSGSYKMAIQLFDPGSEREVDLGLRERARENGYFVVQEVTF